MVNSITENEAKHFVLSSKYEPLEQSELTETKKRKEPSYNRTYFKQEEENVKIIDSCYNYWLAFSRIRAERERNIRYKNGDQWSDTIEDPDNPGHFIKEQNYVTRGGKLPLKHNIVGQIVRNLVGQMLSNPSQSEVFARNEDDKQLGEMLTSALNSCNMLNNSRKLDISIMEDLILSGIGCMKVRYDYLHDTNQCDGKLELVNINRLFFNNDIEDPRLNDISFIGQIHEYSIEDIVSAFASSSDDEKKIRKIFASASLDFSTTQVGELNQTSQSFYYSSNPSKQRIIEVWMRKGHWVNHLHDPLDGSEQNSSLSKSEVEKINKERTKMAIEAGGDGSEIPLIEFFEKYEYFWQVKYLTADGYTLLKADSPYLHGSHPYSIAMMPMNDGLFRSYISDIIDMQRYVNRLIVGIDSILGSSAKGVLMLPEDCIPDGYTIEDFAAEYVKANGVIVYRPSNRGSMPQQIATNSSPAGAWDMLKTQMSLIEQVSGVSDAIQGRTPDAGTAASLYAQRANNSQLNYRLLFETLTSFIKERDEKLLKVLMQFYTQKRVIEKSENLSHNEQVRYWNPIDVDKITEFNLIVSQTFDTPTYKMQFEEHLSQMLRSGYIDFELYLKNSTLPFAGKLLSQINSVKEEPELQKENIYDKE